MRARLTPGRVVAPVTGIALGLLVWSGGAQPPAPGAVEHAVAERGLDAPAALVSKAGSAAAPRSVRPILRALGRNGRDLGRTRARLYDGMLTWTGQRRAPKIVLRALDAYHSELGETLRGVKRSRARGSRARSARALVARTFTSTRAGIAAFAAYARTGARAEARRAVSAFTTAARTSRRARSKLGCGRAC